MLESQLRDQRSIVKDAIAASQKIEQLIRGKVRSSVNLEVANEALSLAKRQLEQYNNQDSAQVYPQPIFTVPNGPSRQPSPMIVPSPPPSPPLSESRVASPPRAPFFPETPSSPLRTPLSPGGVSRGMSAAAIDTMPSGVSVPPRPSRHRNTRAKRPRRGGHPMSGDVGADMGYRTAATLDPRRAPGSRIRNANRNVVWTEHHEGDKNGE